MNPLKMNIDELSSAWMEAKEAERVAVERRRVVVVGMPEEPLVFLLPHQHDIFGRPRVGPLNAVVDDLVAKRDHHARKLVDLLREGAVREVLRRDRMRDAKQVQAHQILAG